MKWIQFQIAACDGALQPKSNVTRHALIMHIGTFNAKSVKIDYFYLHILMGKILTTNKEEGVRKDQNHFING